MRNFVTSHKMTSKSKIILAGVVGVAAIGGVLLYQKSKSQQTVSGITPVPIGGQSGIGGSSVSGILDSIGNFIKSILSPKKKDTPITTGGGSGGTVKAPIKTAPKPTTPTATNPKPRPKPKDGTAPTYGDGAGNYTYGTYGGDYNAGYGGGTYSYGAGNSGSAGYGNSGSYSGYSAGGGICRSGDCGGGYVNYGGYGNYGNYEGTISYP